MKHRGFFSLLVLTWSHLNTGRLKVTISVLVLEIYIPLIPYSVHRRACSVKVLRATGWSSSKAAEHQIDTWNAKCEWKHRCASLPQVCLGQFLVKHCAAVPLPDHELQLPAPGFVKQRFPSSQLDWSWPEGPAPGGKKLLYRQHSWLTAKWHHEMWRGRSD